MLEMVSGRIDPVAKESHPKKQTKATIKSRAVQAILLTIKSKPLSVTPMVIRNRHPPAMATINPVLLVEINKVHQAVMGNQIRDTGEKNGHRSPSLVGGFLYFSLRSNIRKTQPVFFQTFLSHHPIFPIVPSEIHSVRQKNLQGSFQDHRLP
jgi:hypothetical protein